MQSVILPQGQGDHIAAVSPVGYELINGLGHSGLSDLNPDISQSFPAETVEGVSPDDYHGPGFDPLRYFKGIKVVFPFVPLTITGHPGPVSPNVQADSRFVGRGVHRRAEIHGRTPTRSPQAVGYKDILSTKSGMAITGKIEAAVV